MIVINQFVIDPMILHLAFAAIYKFSSFPRGAKEKYIQLQSEKPKLAFFCSQKPHTMKGGGQNCTGQSIRGR